MKHLALIFLLTLTACSTTPMPDGASGIEGQVLVGPSCPVIRSGDPNCADKPFQATLTVLNNSGKKETQFTTGVDGKFRISFDPGDYVLHPETPNGAILPIGQEQSFIVVVGQFTKLIVNYDSGIR